MRVLKGVEVMMRELLLECGEMYGFDGVEAISRLLVKDSKCVKDKRGRPKKAVKEVSCEKVVDLFAGLVSEVMLEPVVTEPVVEDVPVVEPVAVAMDIEEPVVLMEEKMEKEGFGERSSLIAIVKDDCDELADLMGGLKVSENKKVEKVKKNKKLTEEEKALMEAEKEALKLKKEAEKEAAKEALKLKKEAEKEALKLKKEAEKEAAKEALKLKKEAEKEAAKEALKLKKEAEKEALKLKKEAEKAEEKKEKKEPKKKQEAVAQAVAQVEEKKEVLKEGFGERSSLIVAPKITVTRFEFEGKQYLKSSENILYDPKSKEELGIWCEESKTIKELPEEEDDEEMDEESYEE